MALVRKDTAGQIERDKVMIMTGQLNRNSDPVVIV